MSHFWGLPQQSVEALLVIASHDNSGHVSHAPYA